MEDANVHLDDRAGLAGPAQGGEATMTFKVAPRTTREMKPRIVVFGVGGAGGNAVNNMIQAGLPGVEFVVANTDSQHLGVARTDRRIQLGADITQGLGAGANPEVGRSAAEESVAEIGAHLDGAHMVFITAGMGGGTGTGAGPVVARCARERGILTVGVVTKPFQFEGRHRMRLAEAGIAELQRNVDILIVIPNQNLFRVAKPGATFTHAFSMADDVLHAGVRSITDLMVLPGLINLDFADVRTVMTDMGQAMMGTGEASGPGRATVAAQNAIHNPLLDEVALRGARAVLVNVTGDEGMTLLEVDEAANAISSQADPDANIIFGAAFDASLEGVIRVSVVATGMEGASPPAGGARTASPSADGARAAPPAQMAPAAKPNLRMVAALGDGGPPDAASMASGATVIERRTAHDRPSPPVATRRAVRPEVEALWADRTPAPAEPAEAPFVRTPAIDQKKRLTELFRRTVQGISNAEIDYLLEIRDQFPENIVKLLIELCESRAGAPRLHVVGEGPAELSMGQGRGKTLGREEALRRFESFASRLPRGPAKAEYAF